MEPLSERITYVRKELLGVNQERLAEMMDVTRGAIGNWELGGGVSQENLTKLSEIAEVSLDWLVHGAGTVPKLHPLGLDAPAQHDPKKQPSRPHFIPDWAATRGLTQSQLAREIGADKSIVSRWFSGGSPTVDWQQKLATLFNCEPASLFRHPDDAWFVKFIRGRSRDEVNRIKATLEIAFPKTAD